MQDRNASCYGATSTLNAVANYGSKVRWFGSDGTTPLTGASESGNFGNDNQSYHNMSSLSVAGNPHIFYVEAYNPTTGEKSSKNQVKVIVNPLPEIIYPPSGQYGIWDTTVCVSSSGTANVVLLFTYTHNNSSRCKVNWTYYEYGYGYSSVNLGDHNPINLSLSQGIYDYRFSVRDTVTGCSQLGGDRYIRIFVAPAPPTVTNGSRCGDGTVSMSAIVNSGEVARWYNAPIGGNPIPTTIRNEGNTYYYEPYLTESAIPYTYYVEAYNNTTGIASPRVPVTATVNPKPVMQTYPTNQTVYVGTTLYLSATSNPGTTIRWLDTTSGLTQSLPTGTTYNKIFGTTGIYHYVLDAYYANNPTCTSATVAFDITVVPAPPIVKSFTSLCGGGKTSMSAIVNSGEVARWYNVLIGGSEITSDTRNEGNTYYYEPYLTESATPYTYYVEAYNSYTNTVSPRVSVTVEINARPSATHVSGTFETTVGSSNTITYSYDGASGKFELNGNIVANTSNGTVSYNTSGLAVGEYNLKLTITSAKGCTSSVNTPLTIKSGNTPTLPNFPKNGQCVDDVCKFMGQMFYLDTWSNWESFQLPLGCYGRLDFVFPSTGSWYVEYELHDILGGMTPDIKGAYTGGGHQMITNLSNGMFVRFRLKYTNGPSSIQGDGNFQVQLNDTHN
ncbi:MAG: hypothetical protein LBH32_08905 [Dysgonamonadaceae bacterium]|jgi:hypothetical protein|nr:hypothetical protein [Dysgonamonadaceae bacterium]